MYLPSHTLMVYQITLFTFQKRYFSSNEETEEKKAPSNQDVEVYNIKITKALKNKFQNRVSYIYTYK